MPPRAGCTKLDCETCNRRALLRILVVIRQQEHVAIAEFNGEVIDFEQ
jgi:hypothetical protein